MLPRRSFVLGGARSGKSGFAERLIEQSGGDKVYIATAQAFDDEMRTRIAAHQNDRADADRPWRLIEAPMSAAAEIRRIAPNETALLDCATMWLNNQLMAETDLKTARQDLINAIQNCPGRIVTVSNEVGHSIVPENALARRFRDEQGSLNHWLAAHSELAVLVVAGLPVTLKGALPTGFY